MNEDELKSAAGERMILEAPLPSLSPTLFPTPAEAAVIGLPTGPETPQILEGSLDQAFVFLTSCPRLQNQPNPWAGIIVQGWSNAPGVVLPPEPFVVNSTPYSRPFFYRPRISLGFGPPPSPPSMNVRDFPRGPIVSEGNCSASKADGWVEAGKTALVGAHTITFTANAVIKVDFVWIGGFVNSGSDGTVIPFAIRRNGTHILRCSVPEQHPFFDSGYVLASARGDVELLVDSTLEPQPFDICSSRIFGAGEAPNGRYTLWNSSLSRRGNEIGTSAQTFLTGALQQSLFGDDPVFSFAAKAATNYLVRYRESCEVRCVGLIGKTARVEINSEPELIL